MESSPIRKLPPELRQDTWDLLLGPEAGFSIYIADDGAIATSLNITQTCRAIRSECVVRQNVWTLNDIDVYTGMLQAPSYQNTTSANKNDTQDDYSPLISQRLRHILAATLISRRAETNIRLHLHLGFLDASPKAEAGAIYRRNFRTCLAKMLEMAHQALPQAQVLACLEFQHLDGTDTFLFDTLALPLHDRQRALDVLHGAP